MSTFASRLAFHRISQICVEGGSFEIYERLGEDTGGIVQHWTKQMVDSRRPFGKLPGKVGHQIPVLGIGGCRQPRFQIVCLVL